MEAPRGNNDRWIPVIYAFLLIASLAVVGLGIISRVRDGSDTLLAVGMLGAIVTAALFPMAMKVWQGGPAAPVVDQEPVIELLRSINDRLLLSDTAKHLAFREHDRTALRNAILDDIRKHDYEAALALVEEMSHSFGYRQEAEKFREQIIAVRTAEMEQKLKENIKALDHLLARREWDRAMAEVAKVSRLYPDMVAAQGLGLRVRQSRQQHKLELERKFLDAAQREDVDAAMELLKELDKYLTEAEAEPFRETARGVIGKQRQNLGVQFKLAVNDKEWTLAVRIGEQIIREFPNSKMADEVRGVIDVLRDRARTQQMVSA